MTADVDVTVIVSEGERVRMLRSLERAGFLPRVTDVVAFAARTRVIPFVHAATRMPLDLVLGEGGLEQEICARAAPMDLGGLVVPVIEIEDLILTKVLAGRVKDLEDVRNLLAAAKGVDLARVRRALTTMDDLLERQDLLPSFERALKGAKRAPGA